MIPGFSSLFGDMMDPLTITASVVGLTAMCIQTGKALHDFKNKYQYASLTIIAICTETSIISISLSRIQSSMLSNPDGLSLKLAAGSSLEETLDHALNGCYVVFEELQAETQKLNGAAQSDSSSPSFGAKIRHVWNEKHMQDILTQIRGLQNALTLLFQLLGTCVALFWGSLLSSLAHSDTMAELKQILENNTAVISQFVQRASRFRAARLSRARHSIFEMSFSTQSIHSGDRVSLFSSTLFAFDDEVIDSPAYRRALASGRQDPMTRSPNRTSMQLADTLSMSQVVEKKLQVAHHELQDCRRNNDHLSGKIETTRTLLHKTRQDLELSRRHEDQLLREKHVVKRQLQDRQHELELLREEIKGTKEQLNFALLDPSRREYCRLQIENQKFRKKLHTQKRKS